MRSSYSTTRVRLSGINKIMAEAPLSTVQTDTPVEAESLQSSLRKLSVFKGVTVDAINRLLERSSSRFICHGEFIFRQDDPGSSLVIFNKGLAVEFKRSGEVDCLIGYYSGLSVFGESSFLESTSRSTSLYANEDCWVTEVDNDQLKKLSNHFPEQFEAFYINLGREIGKKASSVNDKLSQAEKVVLIRESSLNWDQY